MIQKAEEKNSVERLLSNAKEYIETRLDLLLINSQEKVTDIVSSLAMVFILMVVSIFVILFASAGLAWWIGQSLHNPAAGFFCIAGFYLIVAVLLVAYRDKWIRLPIINALLKKINLHEKD